MNLNFKGQGAMEHTPIYARVNTANLMEGRAGLAFGLTDAWWGLDDDNNILNPAPLAHADIPPFEVKENHAP